MAKIAPNQKEAGCLLFAGPCRFIKSCTALSQLPNPNLPEIAFAGRSNVGKSSLINALVGVKSLAHTSKTPGRTQQINIFDIAGRLIIADLPGYGYARAPKSQIKHWTALVSAYLKSRANLSRTFLLIDARHGFKPSDRNIFESLDTVAQVYQVVLTKCDKVKEGPLTSLIEACKCELATHSAAYPDIAVTSANKGDGVANLRTTIATLARQNELG